MPTGRTPAQAWAELLEGNERFVRGDMAHPSQGVHDRAELSVAQHPFAVVFGCSDSRVAAEIVFDRGLGDLFVVRTAGHVVDTSVIGSLEYGVQVLGTPLVVVLGHDRCGAVAAAAQALRGGHETHGYVRAVVDRVIPSIVSIPEESTGPGTTGTPHAASALLPPETLGREHVRHTVRQILEYSMVLNEAVEKGRCAVVGLKYALHEGRVNLIEAVGRIYD